MWICVEKQSNYYIPSDDANDLVSVFSDIEKEFISLYTDYSHKCVRSTEICDVPLLLVPAAKRGTS